MNHVLALLPLLVACQLDTVSQGELGFTRHTAPSGAGAAAVVAGDLDEDGHSDLVIANQADGDLSILRGDGRGGLNDLGRVAAGDNPVDLALADLNRDGHLDIVVANHDTHYLTLLWGTGTGTFRPAPDSPLRVAVEPHPHAVRAVDMDEDGQVDLIVDDRAARGLLILRGSGGGAFASPGTVVPVGGDPYRGMALGDINGDGRIDLVTPNPRTVGVLLGEDPRRLAFRLQPSVPAAAPFAVALADLDGDGSLDLIVASDEHSPLVQVFAGDGRGGFQASLAPPVRFAPGGKKIAAGDFNGDGVQDAAVTCFESSDVLLLLGGPPPFRTTRLRGGRNPWGLTSVDLNEDGRDDLVVVDYARPEATVFLTTPSAPPGVQRERR